MSFIDVIGELMTGDSDFAESLEGGSDTPLNFMEIIDAEVTRASITLNISKETNKVVLAVSVPMVNSGGNAYTIVARIKEGITELAVKSQGIGITSRETVLLMIVLNNVATGNHTYDLTLEKQPSGITAYDAGSSIIGQVIEA